MTTDRPTLPAPSQGNENFAAAVTEVSERMTLLVREEIELAKAETMAKLSTLARGLAAVAAGAVFGVFALSIGLQTLAWGLSSPIAGTGKIWIGFLIVTALLVILTAIAFLFAWRKLRVGAPTPQMAIDEAKKIRETVTSSTGT
ncbi:MAG: phage holin family protein [Solirubrobacterales bacterium]|nr:phage holin family protein [Solirubrobacterales bacterium]MBV9166299.1 phage holin family protein [Solirubrobacterales bacterium]MBV9534104.1 phage holin family protein [Solirubrobacterales bacterium]